MDIGEFSLSLGALSSVGNILDSIMTLVDDMSSICRYCCGYKLRI